jgi:exonuclease III
VQGLNEIKCHDELVLNFIKDVDCAVLIETWLNTSVSFADRYTYCQPARKSKHGRSKGGIIITMKNILRKEAKILENNSSYMVWVKFNKQIFNLDNDLYMCAVYIPPLSSLNTNQTSVINEIWEELEQAISNYSKKGYIMILGDLNSRTGTSNEYVEYNKNLDAWYDLQNNYENITNRNSKDSVVNSFGRKLLEICRHNDLLILNGRVLGDLHGQFTSFQYNGSSVIDYCIVNYQFMSNIVYFNVLDPSHVSDHAAVKVCMKVKCISENKCFSNSNATYSKIHPGFTWDEQYINRLNSHTVQKRLKNVCEQNYDCDQNGIEKLCSELSEILIDTAKCSLK